MEPPVIYCAWSLPCRSASSDTYGGSPFHLLLTGCRVLLPSGRGGPGGPGCTVVVANSWVGRGAVGLHGGSLAGARAGSFQWQHRGAGDQLIKTLADGFGYGTHVYAWPHDAHLRQLAAWEKDVNLGWEWGAGWGAHGGQQDEESSGAAWWALESPGSCKVGTHCGSVCCPCCRKRTTCSCRPSLECCRRVVPMGSSPAGGSCLGMAARTSPALAPELPHSTQGPCRATGVLRGARCPQHFVCITW